MRNMSATFRPSLAVIPFLVAAALIGAAWGNTMSPSSITGEMRTETIQKLEARFGPAHRPRIESGVGRAAALWRSSDGTPEEFREFCLNAFIADESLLAATFAHIQENTESITGYFHRLSRDLSAPVTIDRGAILPVDPLFAEYSPYAHLSEDFFRNKIAFVVLLNFPNFTLEQKLSLGPEWSRDQWARARLGDAYTARVPAEIIQRQVAAGAAAELYISNYNIYLGNLLGPNRQRPFPETPKLISHWGLRDEIKGQYGDPGGLSRQGMIYRVMERIIDQSIPGAVIDNPGVLWDPDSNQVFARQGEKLTPVPAKPEGGTRYRHLLANFQTERLLDPYFPLAPTAIRRQFEESRQIPEETVEKLLTAVLDSPLAATVADRIRARLGRELRPWDIWYNGFRPKGTLPEQELDRLVKEKYPDVAAFQADLPRILETLGFTAEKARFLSERIVVDPSRGSGHALGAAMRTDQAHLRTRFAAGGMTYKGYNIAVHELGHTVEQVFSLNGVDQYFLSGVPNSAFTECFAFVFQTRDLELLGLKAQDPQLEQLRTLDIFWNTYEIAGVALAEMRIWRWLYAHPGADAAALQQAVAEISREVWNRYYAPVFKIRDVPILGIYSHMISVPQYLADYPLGHLIMFQIENYLRGKNLGAEMERMCVLGELTPSLWMKKAVGEDISPAALLSATAAALEAVK